MARRCFRYAAKLHRGLGQPARRLVENTRLGALEIRRTLHSLDLEISLGELGPFGNDTLAVSSGGEQDRCEAVGPSSQSAHALDELWRHLVHRDHTADKSPPDDPNHHFRKPTQA